MNYSACHLCGKAALSTQPLNGHYVGLLCADCDLLITDLSRETQTTEEINQVSYPIAQRLRIYKRRKREFEVRYDSLFEMISNQCPAPIGSMLEIGSNIGMFADRIQKKGVLVETVEINPDLKSYQEKEFGLTCFDEISKIPAESRYDLIVMMDVLEHIPDPISIIGQLKKHLTEFGVIFIQLPNKNSLAAKRAGTKWSWWIAPDHVYHFSVKGIQVLSEKTGLNVRLMQTVSPWIDDLCEILPLGILLRPITRLGRFVQINPFIPWKGGSLIQAVLSQ